jgi:hypothetical protein
MYFMPYEIRFWGPNFATGHSFRDSNTLQSRVYSECASGKYNVTRMVTRMVKFCSTKQMLPRAVNEKYRRIFQLPE